MSGEENKTIEVTINGDKRSVPAGLTVNGLLDHLNVKKAAAVVEHNRTVLKQRENDVVMINEGDTLEIVRFVGGG
ncbi:MAG: sulfur carrier protein ThiS [bacterium]